MSLLPAVPSVLTTPLQPTNQEIYPVEAYAVNPYAWKRQQGLKAHFETTPSFPVPEHILTGLDTQQREIVKRAVEKRENIYFTGRAGTGKSRVINAIVLAFQHHKIAVGLCSTTGLSAQRIGGQTIHSWSGIGNCKRSAKSILKAIFSGEYKKVFENWTLFGVLVCDEINMLSAPHFHLLDLIARGILKSDYPMGGMQIIFCGDPLQLPPTDQPKDTKVDEAVAQALRGVTDETAKVQIEKHVRSTRYQTTKAAKRYTFDQSIYWDGFFDYQAQLTQVYRQNDREYLKLLDLIRIDASTYGGGTGVTWRALYKTQFTPAQRASAVHLFYQKTTAKAYNETRLLELPGDVHSYEAHEDADVDVAWEDKEETCAFDVPTYRITELKRGAKVMVVVNGAKDTFANGTCGVVVDFAKPADYRSMTPSSARELGPELHNHDMEARGISCSELLPLPLKIPPEYEDQEWPVVECFAAKNPDSTYLMLALPFLFEADVTSMMAKMTPEMYQRRRAHLLRHGLPVTDTPQCRITQIPLILAWAITIHKAQGQEFDKVVLSLQGIHKQPSLLYTAMTRVSTRHDILLTEKYYPTPSLIVGEVTPAIVFLEVIGLNIFSKRLHPHLQRRWDTFYKSKDIAPVNLSQMESNEFDDIDDAADWEDSGEEADVRPSQLLSCNTHDQTPTNNGKRRATDSDNHTQPSKRVCLPSDDDFEGDWSIEDINEALSQSRHRGHPSSSLASTSLLTDQPILTSGTTEHPTATPLTTPLATSTSSSITNNHSQVQAVVQDDPPTSDLWKDIDMEEAVRAAEIVEDRWKQINRVQ